MVNYDRERAGDSPVSLEVFEIIFDKVEKEWFNLVRPCEWRIQSISVGVC